MTQMTVYTKEHEYFRNNPSVEFEYQNFLESEASKGKKFYAFQAKENLNQSGANRRAGVNHVYRHKLFSQQYNAVTKLTPQQIRDAIPNCMNRRPSHGEMLDETFYQESIIGAGDVHGLVITENKELAKLMYAELSSFSATPVDILSGERYLPFDPSEAIDWKQVIRTYEDDDVALAVATDKKVKTAR